MASGENSAKSSPGVLREIGAIVFSRLARALYGESAESRNYSLTGQATPWDQYFSVSGSGVVVTPETSLRASAVNACVNVIANTIGTLPLMVYRTNKNGSREKATDHPLYSLLHDAPNDLLTSCEWREMMQAHLCLRGNGYTKVIRSGDGSVASLEPIHPDRVSIFVRGQDVTYSIQPPEGGPQELLSADSVLHIRTKGPNGVVGYSPIQLARESIGLSLALERHGSVTFKNGARPSGVLETPAGLKPEQLKELRDHWEATQGGLDNGGKTTILSGGMKYSGVSMTNDDAQFLDTRRFQLADIARIYAVPVHKIQDMSGATFSNIEHQSIEFVTDCIRPWAVRWEQRMNQVLLSPAERRKLHIEFSLDGLLRGDITSRYNAYNVGRTGGWLCPDDIRMAENMSTIPGGNTFMQPMNFVKLGDFPKPLEPGAPTAPALKPKDNAPTDGGNIV